ncbi:hypothetical protein ACOMHN_050200 [Nucella lapillus]
MRVVFGDWKGEGSDLDVMVVAGSGSAGGMRSWNESVMHHNSHSCSYHLLHDDLDDLQYLDGLRDHLNDGRLARAWVGGDDLEVAGVFRWKDGTLLPDDSPLWTGDELEPDHQRRGGDCVYLYYSNPGLYDRPCSLNQQQYMCQKDGL